MVVIMVTVPDERNRGGRPPGALSLRTREFRWRAVKLANSYVPEVIEFWAKVMRNADGKYTTMEQIAASDRIMDRALGKPPQSIAMASEQKTQQILEVRWRPPSPDDTSNIIEPEPVGGRE